MHSSLSVGHGARTLWPFVSGGVGPSGHPWVLVKCGGWILMANHQRLWWATINVRSWWCWEHMYSGGHSFLLVGGGGGCQWTSIGGHCHFSIMVVGFVANCWWSWQVDCGCGWSQPFIDPVTKVGTRHRLSTMVLGLHGHWSVVGGGGLVGACQSW